MLSLPGRHEQMQNHVEDNDKEGLQEVHGDKITVAAVLCSCRTARRQDLEQIGLTGCNSQGRMTVTAMT